MTEQELSTRPWSEADDERLRSLARKRMDARSIALEMKRTPHEIRRQASRLNILLRPARPQQQMG